MVPGHFRFVQSAALLKDDFGWSSGWAMTVINGCFSRSGMFVLCLEFKRGASIHSTRVYVADRDC